MSHIPAPHARQPLAPPVARRQPKATSLHGVTLVDDYHWLREKDHPDVLAYLEAENAYVQAGLSHTAALQDTLYREMLGRLKETDMTVPARDGEFWYYTRTEEGRGYPLFCRRRGTVDAPEEIYLDQNQLAEGHAFHGLGGLDVSPDGTRLIYLEDVTGFREYTLYVKDLVTGEILDAIPNVWNGTAWADDNRTYFYVTPDAAKRGDTVWRRTVGAPANAGQPIFQESDPLFSVTVYRSRSDQYILLGAETFTTSEWHRIRSTAPGEPPRVILPRRAGVEYEVEHGEGAFYVVTNDEARNFRIRRAEDRPGPLVWTDWVPHAEDVFIEGLHVFEAFAVVVERHEGLRRLRAIDTTSGASHEIDFPEQAYAVFPAANPEYRTRTFRFTYSSLTTPASVFDYDVATGQRTLRKRQEIPSGFDPSRYEVHRRLAPARDGARVPVSILMRRGAPLDGTSPLLLYAYGAYGLTVEPAFNANVFSLVDRGMAYAIAHVRGGQELGRAWYDEGKMAKKENTFGDFIDAAEHLVASGYTRPDRLVANGGSAGGLLMAVVANRRPDLFRAIVADVPFVDVINSLLDATLPLTSQEWEQWGNPADPEEFACLRAYSPYDNVARQDYPAMLVTTSLNDSQVMYWEPAKWVARLRAMKTDQRPLYLKTNMSGGHSGSSGRYERLRETAFRYAFVLDQVGLSGAEPLTG